MKNCLSHCESRGLKLVAAITLPVASQNFSCYHGVDLTDSSDTLTAECFGGGRKKEKTSMKKKGNGFCRSFRRRLSSKTGNGIYHKIATPVEEEEKLNEEKEKLHEEKAKLNEEKEKLNKEKEKLNPNHVESETTSAAQTPNKAKAILAKLEEMVEASSNKKGEEKQRELDTLREFVDGNKEFLSSERLNEPLYLMVCKFNIPEVAAIMTSLPHISEWSAIIIMKCADFIIYNRALENIGAMMEIARCGFSFRGHTRDIRNPCGDMLLRLNGWVSRQDLNLMQRQVEQVRELISIIGAENNLMRIAYFGPQAKCNQPRT